MKLGLTIPFLSPPPATVSEQSKLYMISSKETYLATVIVDLQNGHTYCKKSIELFKNIEEKDSTHKVISYNEQMRVFEVTTPRYRTKIGYWKGGNKHTLNLLQGFFFL